MAKPKKPLLLRWLFLLPIPVLWCVASLLGWLDFLEHKSIDWRFRFRGERDAPVNVVYVDIDAKSIADLGGMPWDRGYYAEVCAALLDTGRAKAIGVDLVFSEKGQPELADRVRFREGNRKLAQFLFSNPPVVLAAAYASPEDRDVNGQPFVRELPRIGRSIDGAQPPELPEFRMGNALWNPPTVGLIDTIDGGTRQVPLFAPVGERTYFHMAVELARLHWGLPREAVTIRGDSIELARTDGSIQARIPLIEGQDVQVNWFSRWDSPGRNPRASFSEVLAYARMLASESAEEKNAAQEFFGELRDAVVLIGPVDPLLQDLAPTPFDDVPVPRVGIHGNLLKTIVSGQYLRYPSPIVDVVLLFVFTGLICLLAVAGGRHGVAWRALGVLLMLGYAGLALVFFAQGNIVLPLAAPLGAAFTTSFAGVIWQLVVEEKQKSRLKGMFGTYVSPQLVQRLIESGEDPKLGGAEVEVTAFFSDIQDFSAFAEKLSPSQLVELMNQYLTACTDIITAEGGTLDKYIGDAVVAMFGAPVALPDHAFRACVASQLIQQRLAALRKKWTSDGKWPSTVGEMHTRIGLNSGAAVVGNMGSLTRFNYTMMGDNVNLAARLESAAKNYGAGTLVTEMTKSAAENSGDRCVFRFIDRIVVKGRSQPVVIYELMGLKESISPTTRECAAVFNAGIERYLRQDWAGATTLFRQSSGLEAAQTTGVDEVLNPSLVFIKRCEAMALNPPSQGWNGVYVMQTK